MKDNLKRSFSKIGAFVLYLFMVSLPVLYWMYSNWGLASIFNLKSFVDLLKNDISFQLTLASVFIAVGLGVKMILLKKVPVSDDMEANASPEFNAQNLEVVDGLVPMDNPSDSSNLEAQEQYESFSAPLPNVPPPAFNSSELSNFQMNSVSSAPVSENFSVPSFDNPVDLNPVSNDTSVDDGVSNDYSVPSFSAPVAENFDANKFEPSIMNRRYRRNITSIADAFNNPNTFFVNILKNKGYKSFDVKEIDGFDLAFFAVSNKNIVIGYHMNYSGEIIANDVVSNTENVPYPYWFSEMKRFISPIYAVSKIRENIDNLMLEVLPKNHDITIESYCIIDDNAVISNINDWQQKWAEAGVNVVMATVSNDVLPSFNEVIEDVSEMEIMPAFLEFAETLSKYYIQKARIKALKKA